MDRPSYVPDGATIADAIAGLETEGFTGQFGAQEDALVICFTCHQTTPANEISLEALIRTEGASDPDDMAAVAGVECPHCGTKGTLLLAYGPEAPPTDSDVLRELEDAREHPGTTLLDPPDAP